MRKVALIASVSALALILLAPAAEAQPQPFSASFKGKQRLNDPPCAGGAVLCGAGTVRGYGPATYSAFLTGFAPGDVCDSLSALVVVNLSDGQGSLTMSAAGEICYPGNSHETPGGLVSFGNPARIDTTYDVISGTGVFAGATGDGIATVRASGAQSRLSAAGVIDL